jgi:hypothetical protein
LVHVGASGVELVFLFALLVPRSIYTFVFASGADLLLLFPN